MHVFPPADRLKQVSALCAPIYNSIYLISSSLFDKINRFKTCTFPCFLLRWTTSWLYQKHFLSTGLIRSICAQLTRPEHSICLRSDLIDGQASHPTEASTQRAAAPRRGAFVAFWQVQPDVRDPWRSPAPFMQINTSRAQTNKQTREHKSGV